MNLNKLTTETRQYVRGLQRAPEDRKKRWLIAASGTLMVAILMLWVTYVNVTLPRITPQANEEREDIQKESFWATLSRGFTQIKKDLGADMTKLKDELTHSLGSLNKQTKETNDFAIKPTEPNFELKIPPPLPVTKLP
ncbi:hypothetical protein HY967_04645 [Candidatus Jorgensenbacteria bacterium]|nr:hypothetical protein [Candidatus Jorgensenbacteria bacterium]